MRCKRCISVAVTAVFVTVLSVAGIVAPASASTPKGGTVHFYDYGTGTGQGGTIVFTGAIGDGGSTFSIDANGTPDPNNNTEVLFSLERGTFRINIQPLNKQLNNAFNSFQPNTATCSGAVSLSSSVSIVKGSGTGLYKGISGTLNLNFSYAMVGVKYTSGKHKGQCNESNSSPTVASAQIVTGSGTVAFS